MNTPALAFDPVFTSVPRQDHPSPKVHDLGVGMRWGGHSARLYRKIREHAPYAFGFDDVVLFEHDVTGDFSYQLSQAIKIPAGTYYPLTAFMAGLYTRGEAQRDIFAALSELDRLLPAERPVTASDLAHFAHDQGKTDPPTPKIEEPPIGMLTQRVENHGYRLGRLHVEEDRASLDINWQPQPGARTFFTGIVELRPFQREIIGQWLLPGPCGVNQLLRQRFEKIWPDPATCLAPAGRDRCLVFNVPYGAGKSAKQSLAWLKSLKFPVAPRSLMPSPTRIELN